MYDYSLLDFDSPLGMMRRLRIKLKLFMEEFTILFEAILSADRQYLNAIEMP